ncbi:hypothetical protein L6452_26291 [Arctium lappa]|uniref:Uncharacterized protein n=1 Tax=Arctium lappa TaxID=4217 RepID=A0ACB9AD78_ARCLA|nr:hypothetical protein L6452_26291 [Arctium lappa]
MRSGVLHGRYSHSIERLHRELSQGCPGPLWRLIRTSPVAYVCGAGMDRALKIDCDLANVPFSFGLCSLAVLSSLFQVPVGSQDSYRTRGLRGSSFGSPSKTQTSPIVQWVTMGCDWSR